MILPLWRRPDPLNSMEAGEPPTPELRFDGQISNDVSRYSTEIPTKFITYFTVAYCAAVVLHPLFEYYDWYR
jgi:hypothetical protein